MESWQKQHITANLPLLLETTVCNTQLLACLRSRGIISDVEKQDIEGNKPDLKKTDLLYRILQTRTNGYLELMTALCKGNQTGAFDTLMSAVSEIGMFNLKVSFHDNIKCLKELLSESDIREMNERLKVVLIKENYIELVLNSQTSQNSVNIIRDRIPNIIPYYIPRELSTRTKLNSCIFKENSSDVFVFTGMTRPQLTNLASPHPTTVSGTQLWEITHRFILLRNQADWEELVKISSLPIHLINHEPLSDSFILIETYGASELLGDFLSNGDSEEYNRVLSEVEFVEQQWNNSIYGICICDSPGMGKSALLVNIARQMAKRQNTIGAVISLSEFINSFARPLPQEWATAWDAITEYICSTPAAMAILNKLVKANSIKMALCFDGFDEIRDEDIAWTLEILRMCMRKTRNVKVYVTSRRHMQKELEKKLGMIAFHILPFTQANQVDFLLKYWENSSSIPQHHSRSRLIDFANMSLKSVHNTISTQQRDIMGIPLQCFLVAEVYLEQARVYSDPRRESMPDEQLFTHSTLHKIYTRFLEMRYNTLQQSHLNFDQSSTNRESQNQMYIQVKRFHIFKALQLLYPEIADEYARSYNIFDPNASSIQYSLGLLEKGCDNAEENETLFIHRTIAEFIVAELFASVLTEIWITPADCEDFQVKMIKFVINNVLILIQTDKRIQSAWRTTCDVDYTFSQHIIPYFLNGHIRAQEKNWVVSECVVQTVLLSLEPYHFLRFISALVWDNHIHIFRLLSEILKSGDLVRVQEYRNILLEKPPFSAGEDCMLNCLVVWRMAAAYSNVQMVKEYSMMLEECLQLDLPGLWSTVSYSRDSPLHSAIKRLDYEMVEYLLDKFSVKDYDLKLCLGETGHLKTSLNARMDIIKLLINKNPNLLKSVSVQPGLIQTGRERSYNVHPKLIEFMTSLKRGL